MLRTSLFAGVIALAIWFAFGVIGPYPVFRSIEKAGVSVDELNAWNAYQSQVSVWNAYQSQKTAGTWDASRTPPTEPSKTPPPAPQAKDLYEGVNGRNFLISGAIAVFGAVVIVFGLSGIWEQTRKAKWSWPWSRQYPVNGRVDRQEERTGERREPERTYR